MLVWQRAALADRPRRGAVLPSPLAGLASSAFSRPSRRFATTCCCPSPATCRGRRAAAPAAGRGDAARAHRRQRARRVARRREDVRRPRRPAPAYLTYLSERLNGPRAWLQRGVAAQQRGPHPLRAAPHPPCGIATRSSASCRASSGASSSTWASVLFAREARYLGARIELDTARLRALAAGRRPGADRAPPADFSPSAAAPGRRPIAALPPVGAVPLADRPAQHRDPDLARARRRDRRPRGGARSAARRLRPTAARLSLPANRCSTPTSLTAGLTAPPVAADLA